LTLHNAWLHEQRWGQVLRAGGDVLTGEEHNVTFSNVDPVALRPSLLHPARLPTAESTDKKVS
jgi:hypothetical protein